MTLRILFWERVGCGAQSVGMDISVSFLAWPQTVRPGQDTIPLTQNVS